MSLDKSFVSELAAETEAWYAVRPEERRDAFRDVLAFSLATYVEGRAVTPRGYDETDRLGGGAA